MKPLKDVPIGATLNRLRHLRKSFEYWFALRARGPDHLQEMADRECGRLAELMGECKRGLEKKGMTEKAMTEKKP